MLNFYIKKLQKDNNNLSYDDAKQFILKSIVRHGLEKTIDAIDNTGVLI